MYIKIKKLYSKRQDLKFTCSEYESLWLEIAVKIISSISKIILMAYSIDILENP